MGVGSRRGIYLSDKGGNFHLSYPLIKHRRILEGAEGQCGVQDVSLCRAALERCGPPRSEVRDSVYTP